MLYTLLIIFTLVLLIICPLVVVVILMQRPNADAGMGASLGGGAAESAFGSETGNVLTKVSVRGIILFFILCFCLFLGNVYYARTTVKSTAVTPSLGQIVEAENAAKAAAEKPEAPKAEMSAPVAPMNPAK